MISGRKTFCTSKEAVTFISELITSLGIPESNCTELLTACRSVDYIAVNSKPRITAKEITMSQWAEEVLNSIHNLNTTGMDDWELSDADIKEELKDFTSAQLDTLSKNLSKIKVLIAAQKRRL